MWLEGCFLFDLLVGEVVTGYKLNSESNLDKKMRSVEFFSVYFKNFKNILLSNLMFFVPVLLAAVIEYGAYVLFGGLNIFIIAFAIVILNPFFSGITLVCRYICMGKEFSVREAFFRGIKENWRNFLVHGIIVYAVVTVSWLSISMYYGGTKTSPVFWVPLVITGLIVLFVLFSSYYANIMTVTMDIKLSEIYRNCALFSFGELKNNLLTTFALLIFSAVLFTLAIFLYDPIVLLVLGAILIATVIPSTVQYIITFYVYDDMVAILDNSAKKESNEGKDSDGSIVVDREEAEKISQLVPDGDDEYVFHNGRMIKRSLLEEMYKDDIQ